MMFFSFLKKNRREKESRLVLDEDNSEMIAKLFIPSRVRQQIARPATVISINSISIAGD